VYPRPQNRTASTYLSYLSVVSSLLPVRLVTSFLIVPAGRRGILSEGPLASCTLGSVYAGCLAHGGDVDVEM